MAIWDWPWEAEICSICLPNTKAKNNIENLSADSSELCIMKSTDYIEKTAQLELCTSSEKAGEQGR